MVYEVQYNYYGMRKKYGKYFETRQEALDFIEEKKRRSKEFEDNNKRGTAVFRYLAGSVVLKSITLITRKTLVIYNPHPEKKTMGDCSRRALTIFLDKPYEVVKSVLSANARRMGSNYNNNDALWYFMRSQGYKYTRIYNKDIYEIIKTYNKGTYILDQEDHWAALKDGKVYDTGSQAYNAKVIGIWRK